MKIVKGFRLLLEVYGALFWLVILFGAVVQGLLPYQTFIELGALGFYLIFGAGFVLWLVALSFFRERPPASAE